MCIIYFIVALINLGDLNAPQTFIRLADSEAVKITLPETVKNPVIYFYSGITEDSFELSYSLVNNYSGQNKQPIRAYFDSAFKWYSVKTAGSADYIVLENTAARDIDLGEIAVYKSDNTKLNISISGINLGPEEEKTRHYENLIDEQDLIQKEDSHLNSFYFDEIYFAQTAYQYATAQPGYEVVHPPLGKIIQSIPIKLTGRMTPFTWRIMGTITGVFIIIVVYFLAKEIFNSAAFARVAAVLISLSGLHFVQTRIGTVDSYLCLFSILTYLFMIKFYKSDNKLRYFILSGIFFGCACSVKWSGAFCGFGLAILFFMKVKNTIFKKGQRRWILYGVLSFILLPLTIYCTSYLGFPKTTNARSLEDVYNQGSFLYSYHSTETTPHPYSSKWYTWPVSLKPMLYSWNGQTKGNRIYLVENYAISYVSVLGLLIAAFYAIKTKHRPSIIICIAWLSLFVPYIFITRTMFLYHYMPASIFAILAAVNIFFLYPRLRKILPAYLVVVLITFMILYPTLTGI
ncbi:glycosyltransferase family 39 protein [Candidatus Saccharibacteria bacterium]|nr:glycosyltransferase family 39 protein [Candidatus Saccharibacteria bacterium]